MEVSLNYDTCIASGNCGYIAPDIFQNLEEHEGFVSLRKEQPSKSEWPAVQRAGRLCPSGTIFLTGGGEGQDEEEEPDGKVERPRSRGSAS
ncbi:Ferredoxin-2 [Corynebacterium occultum]|uniref:Ferredoxin-2 n=1 Tax=Corynebacterium occultum TaxID=2675219 RepID=A0A6B8VQA2_9CORY|nr:ferredoxin [Corynebacterium occultum]QGU06293.1 Ferredoxin-2 [Corynebacterium occultum]